MGRRQYQVSDEVAYRWSERRRRGDSFRKIASDEKVDRRLVSRVVRGLDKAKHLNEVAAALRDVRAGFLREHLEDLEMAAQRLLEVTAAPSLQGSICVSYLNAESQLLEKIKEWLVGKHKGDWLSSANKAEEARRQVRLEVAAHMAERNAKAVVEDLREHLPHLWSKVQVWEQVAESYEASWKELAKQAIYKGIAQGLLEPGLRVGLHFLSEFEQKEDLPRVPLKLETASDVGVWLFRNGKTRDSLRLFHQNREELEAAYARLVDILNPFELRKTLLERQCKHCPLA